jgi:hypothetical protein
VHSDAWQQRLSPSDNQTAGCGSSSTAGQPMRLFSGTDTSTVAGEAAKSCDMHKSVAVTGLCVVQVYLVVIV